MASAAEAEIGATFINGKEAVPIHTPPRRIGYPQPATPLRVNNLTAKGSAEDFIKHKRSKEIDISFYWIKDCESQGQLLVYWKPGITNLEKYHTEHHPPAHNCLMRSTYLNPTKTLANHAISHILHGCVNFTVPTRLAKSYFQS